MTQAGSKSSGTRTINVGALARVEGEGALHVKVRNNKVRNVQFSIFEPPRFFEAFLRGRPYHDAPDITARICGICPVAYMMGATHAMEDALGVQPDPRTRALRRILYCGEWIQSHVLHAYMLHAPDFLGYQDSLALSKDYPGVVEKALELKKLGNDLMDVVGGRAVHPVNVRVGGFYRAPRKDELTPFVDRLKWGVEAARETIRLFATFDYPDVERDYTWVAMRHPEEYAITEGRLVSNTGLDIPLSAFPEHFEEEHVEHSNALHCSLKGVGPYHVGPMARYNLNFDQLSGVAKEAAREGGLGPTVNNPFKSLLVRAVEVLYACDEARRLIEQYDRPPEPAVAVTPGAGTGVGCTEAPRGLCWHTYTLDGTGHIDHARIVPPTSQNQKTIEEDLVAVLESNMDLEKDQLQWVCEQAIRNYDPCISCATHFLNLTMEQA